MITVLTTSLRYLENKTESLGGLTTWFNLKGDMPTRELESTLTRHPGIRVNVIYWIPPGEEVLSSLAALGRLLDHRMAAICLLRGDTGNDEPRATRFGFDIRLVRHVTGAPTINDVESALRLLERQWLEHSPSRRVPTGQEGNISPSKDVLMIGAGCTNLVAAYLLARDGFYVTLLDQGPDPRSKASWRNYGATMAGLDARMYSLTEVDNYNEKGSHIYDNMAQLFETPISLGGWLGLDPSLIGRQEAQWQEVFRTIPAWAARAYTADLYSLSVRSWNQWQSLIADDPQLFKEAGAVLGVLRTYEDAERLQASSILQDSYGMLEAVLDPPSISRKYPALRPAVKAGKILGALEVRGFTLGIHRFCRLLLNRLEQFGGSLRFGESAISVARNSNDEVTGIQTNKAFLSATHFILSVGAQPIRIADASKSLQWCQAVGGMWRELEGCGLTNRSMKIKRKGHLVEDVNVTIDTIGSGNLLLGGGYIYAGTKPGEVPDTNLSVVQDQLDDMGSVYFARPMPSVTSHPRVCWRPWTPTGLGIFDLERTTAGGWAMYTGGHNTGGFALAPIVADAVRAALYEMPHDIHVAFAGLRQTLSVS